MAINPSEFHKLNVLDSCAIDNILSSQLLYVAAQSAGCHFCCTSFVYYECLYNPRKNPTPEAIELQSIFRKVTEDGKIKNYNLELEDLQEVLILEKRKQIGKGELASIVFARKTNQAFLTDDQGARKLASEVMNTRLVQTTPHLLGWLFFANFLGDSDLQPIINEHEKKYNRKLAKYFTEMYLRALDYRSKMYLNVEVANDNEVK
ncbi:hypothetical protein [Cylindrospermum sp. FACHB-282]|uniref:hypothetical protein n=1 Tax=Cylindrospermum sp. FACHB-282 TaxID=2692794 RepID=UPI001688A360|nr:hypothetical protein [Cylindrospermum sp. FACHB-282]MBD2384151.1 hypothetical protein [Cylindrospermum sp. FACHB-282]